MTIYEAWNGRVATLSHDFVVKFPKIMSSDISGTWISDPMPVTTRSEGTVP